MTELRPTKARLALLQAVADGEGSEHYGLLPTRAFIEWDHGPGYDGGRRYQKVTARAAKFHTLGWVRLGERASYKAPRRIELTPAGAEVLRQNGGTP